MITSFACGQVSTKSADKTPGKPGMQNVQETTQPRLLPKNMDEMRPEWTEILSRLPGAGLKGKYTPVNVFGLLMYNPNTMGPFLDYWVTSKLKMGLSIKEQELVILRMAVFYRCNYVWKHHIPVGVESGITDKQLTALKEKGISPGKFNAREAAILKLTDEMMNQRTIRDDVWATYHAQLKDSEILDLISLVSQYVFFSLLNNSLKVGVEPALRDIPSL